MRAVKKTQNSAYQIHYHFVTPVKYRRAIFGNEERYEIEMEQIGIDTNHVHYLVSAAPKYAPAELMQIIKSITARELFKRHPDLKEQLWGGELWSEGYFVATIGEGGNKDVIRAYVANQGKSKERVEQLKLFNF
jgi:putative transposase